MFNWECCGGCGAGGYPDNDGTMELMHTAISHGHMVMVADFSLKAAITDWRVSAASLSSKYTSSLHTVRHTP